MSASRRIPSWKDRRSTQEGNLYVVNFAFGEIVRITENGEPSIFCSYDGAPNGLQVGPDGMIYVADRLHGIMRLDPTTRKIALHCGLEQSPDGFVGLSDLTIAGNGDIYFTDQGNSHLLPKTPKPHTQIFKQDRYIIYKLEKI